MRVLKLSLICTFVMLAAIGWHNQRARASSSGPPASHTGAPSEPTCAISGCHGFTTNDGPGTLTLTGLPELGYALNEQYDVTVTLTQAQRALYGFEMTAIDANGRAAGQWDNLEPRRIDLVNNRVGANTRVYAGHTQAGTAPNGPNQSSWVLRWKAPATNIGRVTFYVVGNAANGNGATSGDFIYTINRSIPFFVAAPQAVATVSAASFAQGALAGETIAALFAQGGLSLVTVAATTTPLPTVLSGVTVRVKDAANVERDARLFFVSPQQINFLTPQGTSNGTATITVLRDNNPVGAGTLNIETVAPGLFAANANGQGVAAAVVLRVKPDGTQSIEPIARFNAAANRNEALPLDFGPESDRLFLILFGTGFRLRSALGNVNCTIGGTNAAVDFAGAQGDLAGLDQANIQLPRSLAGRNATLDLILRADGKAANTVQMAVK
ncbi:MAG: hypothetical protein HYR56_30830 [Acidobacteria bacterium]|nr:hypothetical protein [Acidobacteriota bacterium]MBI3426814.1 hypothetical protein [Acidobacteriota bacterium]